MRTDQVQLYTKISMIFILASASEARRKLLQQVGLAFDVVTPDIDEGEIHASEESPLRIAMALAHKKAQAVTENFQAATIIAADQTLDFEGQCLTKASDPASCVKQLIRMSGKTHHLHSAVTLFIGGHEVWSHCESVSVKMRPHSPQFLSQYVETYWTDIRHCVGGYRVEAEGARLIEKIDGDYFSVLGMPLLPLCTQLETLGAWDNG